MNFYKYNNEVFLKVANNEFVPLFEQNENNDFLCIYPSKDFKNKMVEIELHEIIFNEEIKEQLLKKTKHINFNITENCKSCSFYSTCKYRYTALRQSDKTNKILKEYKDFIESIETGD